MERARLKSRRLRTAMALAALATVAAAISLVWPQFSGDVGSAAMKAGLEPAAAPGGPFSLLDHTGKRVSDQTFRGSFLLIFFGYTYCPDFCPTTLQAIALAMDTLGGKSARIRPLFITIDPERDTPEALASYVGAFGHRIVGLTGTPEEIRKVANEYRVYFAKSRTGRPGDGDTSHYTVDHSAFTYLMGPDGKYLTHFAYGVPPQTMAKAIRQYIDNWK
ncbi:MAG: SCO family protein [Betaproteobacteria bacterium]|nr:SCO family protein [Betaproteobacteria bacterium]